MPKKKLTIDKEFLDLILKSNKDIKDKQEAIEAELVLLKEKKPTQTTNNIVVKGTILHQGLTKDQQTEFFNKLREFMIKNKVVNINVELKAEL